RVSEASERGTQVEGQLPGQGLAPQMTFTQRCDPAVGAGAVADATEGVKLLARLRRQAVGEGAQATLGHVAAVPVLSLPEQAQARKAVTGAGLRTDQVAGMLAV